MLEIGSKMLKPLAIAPVKTIITNPCRHYLFKNALPNGMQGTEWKYIIDAGYWLYNDVNCSAQDSHKPG